MRGIIELILLAVAIAGLGPKVGSYALEKLAFEVHQKITQGPRSLEGLSQQLTGKRLVHNKRVLLERKGD